MPAIIQLNMTRGELTPYLHARIDLDHYKAGLGWMRNWVPLRFGGMTRVPGTVYYGEAKHHDKKHRGIPFAFNRTQTYRIEAGNLYFRFWNAGGRIESPPGTPIEVVTPYLEADLHLIQIRQIGDVIYVVCDGYWPRTLTRSSETSWALALYVPQDGPYLDANVTATTLDPSAASGSVTITASAVTGINGGAGFQAADVGRVIRFFEAGGRWYWFVITAWTSTTVVTATYMGRDDGDTAAMPGHVASANWKLGAWAAYQGYPKAIGLYEDRLVTAGTDREPTTVWATTPGDTGYDDYSVQSPLADDDAVTARLSGGQLNGAQWIADGKDIIIGTEGSLRVLGRNDESAAFGPNNLRQRPETNVPTGTIPGFFIEQALLFLDVYHAKLYEALYANEAQGYVARELSALNEHLLGYGVTSIAYQASPHKIIWMTTENGLLLAAVYDRDQEVFGVSQCDLGGDGFAEDVMTLPGTTKDGDQLWVAVRRTVDGSTVRYVEVLSAFYREGYSAQEYPVYGHCSGVYEGAAANVITVGDYLEGETVGVWADGTDVGDATVEDGEITLPLGREAETVVWGIRYSSLSHTLRLAEYGNGEPGLGRPVVISSALIDFYQTGHLRVGAGALTVEDYDDGLYPLRWEDQSEQDPYAAATLRTGTHTQTLDDSWSNAGVCTIETDRMYPATVRAITVFPEGED
jgi:hypothetical protein